MKGLHWIGIFLLLLGMAMAATSGFSFEERKKLLQIQNSDRYIKGHSTNNWPWAAGSVAVLGSIVIFVLRSRKRS